MKKQLLFTFSGMLMTLASYSQTTTTVTLVNPSFELPNDSVKIPCSYGYVPKKGDTIAFNKIPGFGWKIDDCNDEGREDPKKAGGMDATSKILAYDGWHVMYSHASGGHFYQVVGKVAKGDKYTLSDETIYSYSDVDTSYSGVYISLFSGTDTTKRTIVAGDSTLWDNTAGDVAAWTLVYTSFTVKDTDAGKTLVVEFGCSSNNEGSYTYFYHDSINLVKTTATVGIATKESNLSNIQVYPNPSSDGLFNLRNVSTGTASVYDLLGKLVYSQSITNSNQLINLSAQGKGLYILKVTSNNTDKIQKLVIK